jgi:RHS repeat-associated protein
MADGSAPSALAPGLPAAGGDRQASHFEPPAVTLPKGGGAVRPMGEKFAANPVTGTASMTIPIPVTPGRAGSGPSVALSYDSGSGNGAFGFGWSLSLASVSRRTDRGIPRYQDAEHSDVFTFPGADDLVPVLVEQDGVWVPLELPARSIGPRTYRIERYRPRVEGMFALIERWTNEADATDTFWRSISRDNATTWYGKSAASRIADPADPARVFRWLVCEHHDDKGNVVIYEYKRDDSTGIDTATSCERNRTPEARAANLYPKRIRYGNRSPYYPGGPGAPPALPGEWLFEIVFDYGEHDTAAPLPDGAGAWASRADPFSSYRAGFELRTYRLCRRVLVFHHFPDEPGVGVGCLVRSTDLTYAAEADPTDAGSPVYSQLVAATQVGYLRDGAGYISRSLPPVEFEYSRPVISAEIREVDADSVANLPAGLDPAVTRWVDLDGEGISGVLTEQADAWFYKRNLSPVATRDQGDERVPTAAFGPLRGVALRPSIAELARGRQLLVDLAGTGRLDLVEVIGAPQGFYERSGSHDWAPFRPFRSLPSLDWSESNLRLLDLTGDGLPDVVISEEEAITWYPSLGEDGFGEAEHERWALDEERGPRLMFADESGSVFLADMSGDGLVDLVRIRNGEVSYWPSLGYGRFGAKITMDNSPVFDRSDLYDPARLRIADIDGSGTTDLLYLGSDGVRIYFNQSGNGWGTVQRLPAFPPVSDIASVEATDLLGNGTACLVWSSRLPGTPSPIRYVDLMSGRKPHLLVRAVNNLGAETAIEYAPSTRFYLADELAGSPWITKLPFPVHVVERVEVRDRVAGTRLVSRFEYHHGYFDGLEREFRGFAMAERHDSEGLEDYVLGASRDSSQETAPELFQPPVTTRSWYHTGALIGGESLLHPLRHEYYLGRQHLPDPVLPRELGPDEWAECLRALRGLQLRQEIYSFDGSPVAANPYGSVESTYEVRRLQPRSGYGRAVFFVVATESVTHSYDRDPGDPRCSHHLNLELDELGNPVTTASVMYGRTAPDAMLPAAVQEDQARLSVMCATTDYTPDINVPDPAQAYRLRAPFQTTVYELTGASPAGEIFTAGELREALAAAALITYETVATTAVQRRRVSQRRMLFRDDSLVPLPLGQRDTLGLEYEQYRLAFADGVLAEFDGKVRPADLTAGGYVDLDGDGRWWAPSGHAVYPARPADHFYLPAGGTDPLGVETTVQYDAYDLLPETIRVTQAAWNVTAAQNDYRVLGSVAKTDPNGNRTAVELDALGMVVKLAVMGKPGADEGDTLADPTTRMEYDLGRWMTDGKPVFVRTLSRETHRDAGTRWQESIAYSNGSGGVALVKARVPPGKALVANPDGTTSEVDADPRWIGNGRTVFTNKGLPVKEYEPYFSATSEYEDAAAVRRLGETPVMFYDAVGRNVRTLFPDGTLTRIDVGAWRHRTFDANDTVLESDWYAQRGRPDPDSEPEPLADPERRAAWLAARHAGTAAETHFDPIGRAVYAVSDYGGGTRAATRFVTDLTGRYTKVIDAFGREISAAFNGPDGLRVHSDSAEKGRQWTFVNVLGAVVRAWDEHGREVRTEFDALQRPVAGFARESGGQETMTSYVVFGDRHPDAANRNLLGAPHQVFDQAGMTQVERLDFKGNPGRVDRVLARTYDTAVDWNALAAQPDYAAVQAAAAAELEAETFTATMDFDALSRPTSVTLPDGTSMVPTYAEANVMRTLAVRIAGQETAQEFLTDQDYDAKGRRLYARHGNGVVTQFSYDPKSNRLVGITAYPSGSDPTTQALQRLTYTYDPVGNVVQMRDDAQQTRFFANTVVEPVWLFQYDALYQLVRAQGREHAGGGNDVIRTDADLEVVGQLPHSNDETAVRRYTEEYEYDLAGNITQLAHRYPVQPGAGGGWTRRYRYAYQDDPADRTNRLTRTSLPGDLDGGPYSAAYSYDAYGNMTRMPHLSELVWNSVDQLKRVDLGSGSAHYTYGAGGQRIRKVVERGDGVREERISLGPLEIYRERAGADPPRLERRTVHVHDIAGRVAQVDVKTIDTQNSDPANPLGVPLVRYEYTTALGSATLQTDATGQPVSYEEYHPWGTSAYRSLRSGADASLKRYRFTRKERDAETGFYYYGARYYAPWLGRWTSSDPGGLGMGTNQYRYCRNNPLNFHDPTGLQDKPLSPLGEVSWEVPQSVFMKGGERLPSAQAVANFESWLASAHPDRKYTPGSVTIDWSTADGRRGPTYNAEWLGSNGQPLLPREGEFGWVAPMRKQPRAEYQNPGTRSGRKTENEHTTPRAQQKAIEPGYGNSEYRNDPTVRSPRGVSLPKTRADNQQSAAIQQRVANGQPVDITADVDMPSNANFHNLNNAARANGDPHIPNPGSIDRGTMEQIGKRFERGRSQALPAGAAIGEPVIEDPNPSAQTAGPPPQSGSFGFAASAGVGGNFALAATRTFVPGVAEAEIAFATGSVYAYAGGYATAGLGLETAAAYTPVVGGSLVAGAIGGNVAESLAATATSRRDLQVAAGVIGAAATGAAIGALLGSVVPIAGTVIGAGAGAAIGAIAGLAGYIISKYW